VAEFLILAGTWRVSEPATVLGAAGLVAATIYSLWLVQRVFQGRETPAMDLPDLSLREGVMLAAMFAPLLWLGVYPQPVISTARPALTALQAHAPRTATPAAFAARVAPPAPPAPPAPQPVTAPPAPPTGVSQ
jgi:NADH-quinone oxidoreductase subunit M